MFVIYNSGDSLHLEFNATPVPSGMERDFYLVTDGYFKEPFVKYLTGQYKSTVEPLPFHAMSTYPYFGNEHYPTDLEHKEYQQKYNTRVIGSN